MRTICRTFASQFADVTILTRKASLRCILLKKRCVGESGCMINGNFNVSVLPSKAPVLLKAELQPDLATVLLEFDRATNRVILDLRITQLKQDESPV